MTSGFNVVLSQDEITTIIAGLGELQFKRALPVFQNMLAQMNARMAASASAPAPAAVRSAFVPPDSVIFDQPPAPTPAPVVEEPAAYVPHGAPLTTATPTVTGAPETIAR